jgi:hypothetical protein
MSTADKQKSNVKLIVALVLLFIGINGLLTLVAEKAYQSIGDDSAYFFQLSWWVSMSFTLLVCAILSGFLAQFSSLSRCVATFFLLLVFKAVFAGSTFLAFNFVGPYNESIAQAGSAAAFSSFPAAIIHIVFAFITILFIRPFSSGERHEESEFHIEMPSFEMPKMDTARPRLHSAPNLNLAGEENSPHPVDQDQQGAGATTTDFVPPLPPVMNETLPGPTVDSVPEPKPEVEASSDASAPPLIQKPSETPLLNSPPPEADSSPTLLNPMAAEKPSTPTLLNSSPSEGPPSLTPLMDASRNEGPVKGIEIVLADIVDQIDARNFNCPQDKLSEHGFSIDPSEIIPQLAEGKVTVSAADVLSKVSADILRIPAAEIAKKLPEGKIVIPLDKIVPHLPEETFSLTFPQEKALGVDDIPDPFEEGEPVEEEKPNTRQIVHSIPGSAAPELHADLRKQGLQSGPEQVEAEVTEPEQPSRLEEAIQAAAQSHETVMANEQPLPAGAPESLEINLAFVISRLPENSLGVTFAELQEKIKTPGKLAVPTQVIAPQIRSGKVALTAGQVISMFPSGCISKSEQDLARGLPEGGLELSLDDIVGQLPEEFFNVTHETEAVNVDDMTEVFKDPGHALSPEERSPILTDIEAPPEGTMEVFQRFVLDQEEEQQEKQEEAAAEDKGEEKVELVDSEVSGPAEATEVQANEPAPIQHIQEDEAEDKAVEEQQPAGQIAGLMSNVESTLPEKIEDPKPAPAELRDIGGDIFDVEDVTDQTLADEIINSINQTNLVFSAGMKLYRSQKTFVTTLVRRGIDPDRLVNPLPEVVSSLVRFTEGLQLGGLERVAFVSQTGSIDIEFPGPPASGRWVLLADNKNQSLGVLLNYFNTHCDGIVKIFDTPGIGTPAFAPSPLINDSENKYHEAGNLTAGLNLDMAKQFAISRAGGFHWEVMLKEERPLFDQSLDSFELLEPILRYTPSAGWGQSMLILLRTGGGVFALTQPADRDTMCLMLGYPSGASDGSVAYEAAKVCSLVEQSL